MSVFRIVFLGTPEIAKVCLDSMTHSKMFDVVGVVTQPDRPKGRKMQLQPSPVKLLAQEKNIPVLSPENINHPEVLLQIKEWKAEAAVVVAFGQIVSQDFLNLFPNKVVNVHTSLLPRLRGAAPIQRAIMQGDTETGVSLQVMTLQLDAGDVIGYRKTPLTDDKDALTLHDELALLGADLLKKDFVDFLYGSLITKPQDSSKITYAKKIDKSESVIFWDLSAREIFNRMRGLKLGPGSVTTFQGKRLKIHKAECNESTFNKAKPGQVVLLDKESFTIACGQGTALKILEVQPESKSKMPASDFIRGYGLKEGDYFGQ